MLSPVIKPLTYISPSTFLMWKHCQNKVYLMKLAGHKTHRLHSRATAIGSLFDVLIKDHINVVRKLKLPHLSLTGNIGEIKKNCPQDLDFNKCLEIAQGLLSYYKELPLIDEIMNCSEINLDQELYKNISGIPLLGILDCNLGSVPLDWKTRGFVHDVKTTSPTKGFDKRFTNFGEEKPPHKEKSVLELHNSNWAVSMAFYNWLCGGNGEYIIHELVNTTKSEDKLEFHVTRLSGKISLEFFKNLLKEVENMWETVNSLYVDIEEPLPSLGVCEAYGAVCEMSQFCSPYKLTLGSPNREDYT